MFERLNYSLKYRLLVRLVPLALLVGTLIWLAFNYAVSDVAGTIGQYVAEKQALYDRSRIMAPILQDAALAKHLAQSPVLIAWAMNEDDANLKQEGIRELESYRSAFRDKSYFFVIDQSGDYYFNNDKDEYAGNQLRYTLVPDMPKDAWYYATKQLGEQCHINVNNDPELITTKVGINCLVRSGDQIVGIVGTGLDLTGFVQTVVKANQAGVFNFTTNHAGAIQASPNMEMIDYASLTHAATSEKNIYGLLDNAEDRRRFKQLLNQMSSQPESAQSIFVTMNGHHRIISVANMKDIDWFNVTVIDLEKLGLGRYFLPFAVLIGLALLLLIILAGVLFHRMVLSRIQHLDENVGLIKAGGDALSMQSDVADEIGRLNNNFIDMASTIKEYSAELEKKVAERTRELKKTVLEVEASEQKFKKAFHLNPDAINITRLDDGIFVSINQGFTQTLGYTEEEVIGRTSIEFNIWDNPEDWERMVQCLKKSGVVPEIEARFRTKDGNIRDGLMSAAIIDIEGVPHVLSITRDITERKQAEETINRLAYFDSLTKLPNRQLFLDRLNQAMAQARRSKVGFSLFFLDLDGFKLVNDSAGHEAGDRVLMLVAERLSTCVREVDTVARHGGDEFTFILPGIVKKEAAAVVARKIVTALGEELIVDDRKFTLGASIGIAIYPVDGDNMDALLHSADDAMYAAKKAGKSCYKFSH